MKDSQLFSASCNRAVSARFLCFCAEINLLYLIRVIWNYIPTIG